MKVLKSKMWIQSVGGRVISFEDYGKTTITFFPSLGWFVEESLEVFARWDITLTSVSNLI